jgi:flagellar biosynthesis protein FlhG
MAAQFDYNSNDEPNHGFFSNSMGAVASRDGGAGRGVRTVAITSGKGGVGKTSIVANLAVQLGKEGKRVLILDGDLGMANVDIMFAARPERTIRDVLCGAATARQAIIEVAKNVSLLAGGSGIFELQGLGGSEKQVLLDQVGTVGADFDFMLVDTAPGIADNVLYLNSAAQEIVVVVTPDPASVADSYALIKVLNQRHRENRFSILCNQVRDEAEGARLFRRIDDVASRFLCVGLDYKGSIPLDPILRQATKAQEIVCRARPDCPSAEALRRLATRVRGPVAEAESCKGGLQFFWERALGVA